MGRYKLHGSCRASHLLVVRAQKPVISLERMHSALVVCARVQRNFHSAARITMRPLGLFLPACRFLSASMYRFYASTINVIFASTTICETFFSWSGLVLAGPSGVGKSTL